MALFEEHINNEYLRFLIILIGTIIFISMSYFILKFIVHRIAGSKKTYGRFIIKKLSKPVFYLIFSIGLYIAIGNLSFIGNYYLNIGANKYLLYQVIDGIFFAILTFVIALLTIILCFTLKSRSITFTRIIYAGLLFMTIKKSFRIENI